MNVLIAGIRVNPPTPFYSPFAMIMVEGILTNIYFILSAGLLFMLFWRRHRSLPLPPSPKGHPLLGHLFTLPASDEHLAYAEIGKTLNSDIISFTVLGQVIVVLNSAETALDLLSKRGVVYSDKPELPMLNDERLCGWGKITTFVRYGERWKKQRIMTQAALDPSGKDDLWMTAATMLSSVYGYEPAYPHDEFAKLVETASDQLCEAAVPANFYVNTLPWLVHIPSWFPGAGWKQKSNEWRNQKNRIAHEPFEWTKQQMSSGVTSPSVLKTLLTELTTGDMSKLQKEEEEDIIRWVTGTLYMAGADTTVSTGTSFLLAMILYPDVQKKIQVELDNVLKGRLCHNPRF
ncbi:cytochrome P450 family protein [Ceratobasidium sp. AG-Ba]|nr:cytochrome P450 family protein [Ceratobasidium sp. AG-Ba]